MQHCFYVTDFFTVVAHCFSWITQIHPSISAYHYQAAGGLEPIAATVGWVAGYALDKSQVFFRANTERQTAIHTQIPNLESPVIFGLWEENPCKHRGEHADATLKGPGQIHLHTNVSIRFTLPDFVDFSWYALGSLTFKLHRSHAASSAWSEYGCLNLNSADVHKDTAFSWEDRKCLGGVGDADTSA